jgi:hypothetical protein
MRVAALAFLSLAATWHAQQRDIVRTPVRAEFRIFSGTGEVTASTRLRVMRSGTRDQPIAVTSGNQLIAHLVPGIYDVQALLLRNEAVVQIKWAERLVVMYYPDEDGRHLEVINFQAGFGALQVRTAPGTLRAYEVMAFPAATRSTPVAPAGALDDYLLFVLPAGRYDLRVRPAGVSDNSDATRWFLDIEVPADRTRMKFIGS